MGFTEKNVNQRPEELSPEERKRLEALRADEAAKAEVANLVQDLMGHINSRKSWPNSRNV